METNLPTLAGFISTALFAVGTLPMLTKAFRTKNLASYSLGNILLSNVGNVIYSLYVFNLPPGPVWFLHGYNLLTTGLMLVWYFIKVGVTGRALFVNMSRYGSCYRSVVPRRREQGGRDSSSLSADSMALTECAAHNANTHKG